MPSSTFIHSFSLFTLSKWFDFYSLLSILFIYSLQMCFVFPFEISFCSYIYLSMHVCMRLFPYVVCLFALAQYFLSFSLSLFLSVTRARSHDMFAGLPWLWIVFVSVCTCHVWFLFPYFIESTCVRKRRKKHNSLARRNTHCTHIC